jgi:hypothetical protein
MKMNKYLQKIAGIEKAAWDSDHEEDGRYYIMANRTIGRNPHLHDELLKASKHKDFHVFVNGPKGEEATSDKPEKFNKVMDDIRQQLGPKKSKEQHDKDHTMDWHRGYSWGVGIKMDHPEVQKLVGKEDKDWGYKHDKYSAAMRIIHKNLDL